MLALHDLSGVNFSNVLAKFTYNIYGKDVMFLYNCDDA